MTYLWNWSEAASDAAVLRLYDGAGRPAPADRREAASLLERLLTLVGGLPVAAELPALADLADGLIGEACTRYLSGGVAPQTLPGVALAETSLPFAEEAVPAAPVPVNWCDADRLAALPALGQELARRVVAQRRAGGEFSSLADLDARVAGVGPDTVRRLAGCLSFAPATAPVAPATGAQGLALFAVVVGRAGEGGTDPVRDALERLVAQCAREPHPSSAARRARVDRSAVLADLSWVPSAWVAELSNTDYAPSLAAFLDGAAATVDVCMFHIALGAPTRPMIDALIAAAGRGVTVRVLLDRDRAEDPYNSTVVNARARRALTAGGVAVRQDTPGRLLHSKYVVVDGRLVVIGSHNWSTGSFADYDDTSVALDSPALADTLTRRFDALWT